MFQPTLVFRTTVQKNGIYNGVSESPETILSEDTLFNRPDFFYKFVMNNMYFPHAKPNLIHQKKLLKFAMKKVL